MKKLLLLLSFICIAQLNAQIITTVAGNGFGAGTIAGGYSGDGGQATAAELNLPSKVIFDAFNNMYIVEIGNNRVRKVNTNGIITTFAGNGVKGFSGDGGPATAASLYYPDGLAFDSYGNLLIADDSNYCIRMINTAGIISTIAGTPGVSNYSGDGGPATNATFKLPRNLTTDVQGNIYITDMSGYSVRKINTAGIISTFAGTGVYGYTGDSGLAVNAKMYAPHTIAFDIAGNAYITDFAVGTVRMINTAGIINTIIGIGGYQASIGDGGQASNAALNYATGVAVDATGNIYVSDYQGLKVRMVNTAGIINTIAGGGLGGYSGDGGQATAAGMSDPVGLTFDAKGDLYIADIANHVIRKVAVCTSILANFTLTADTVPHNWFAYPNYSANVTSARWYWGDGTSNISLYPSHIYSAPGLYNICVTAYTACGDSVSYCQTDSVYRLGNSSIINVNVINNATGISIYNTQHSIISIYPNPAQNIFTVEVSNTDKQTISIFDINGKQVLIQTINGKTIIDASNLNAGVYNVNITNSESVLNKKLIIVK